MAEQRLLKVVDGRRGAYVLAIGPRLVLGQQSRLPTGPRYLDLRDEARELARRYEIEDPRIIMTFYTREGPEWMPEEASRPIKVEIYPRRFGNRFDTGVEGE